MSVRLLTAGESEAVWRLEAASTPYHWSHPQWQYSLEQDHCYGIERDRQLVAVCALTLTLDEATLLNIAVVPAFQGRGLARSLLINALKKMKHLGAGHCFLEVRESNAAARHLYQSMGFEEIGRRRGYYPAGDNREDALVMIKPLNGGFSQS